ncbi:unnamed protein product [Euphydryas editha]|uniref:Tc1-like transposase DDE domain-containing protein n=1 Tax=Euphydryas editha TaxID=104508 RepID=A0AAU9T8Q5_EUPED|nr:unnamed protein product [Euphydryas editha]
MSYPDPLPGPSEVKDLDPTPRSPQVKESGPTPGSSQLRNPDPSNEPSRPKKRKRIPDPPSFLLSPMKKRPVSSHLTENEKTIAINVYKYINKTMVSYPYKTEIIKRTAEIIGTSEKTIQRVINEQKNPRPPSAKPRKIHQLFHDQELPTVDKVLRAVNDDEDLPSFKRSTMNRILKKLNFKYSKRSRNSVLLDRPDLIIWRTNYLLRNKDLRSQGRKIYYMDETWVNEGHTANYIWVDQDVESCRQAFLNSLSTGLKNPQKGKRLIVIHIGSEYGFLEVATLFLNPKKLTVKAITIAKWMLTISKNGFKISLQTWSRGSVIVMDNARYHSSQLERLPNMGWRNAEIQEWLRIKEIFFKEEETKAHLMAKIDTNKHTKKYFVDQCAATKNITVIRLAPYHCELNPIELIWAQIKSYVGRNNKTYKLTEVKQLLQV